MCQTLGFDLVSAWSTQYVPSKTGTCTPGGGGGEGTHVYWWYGDVPL